MNLTQLTRRFTIRTRMLGTVAMVTIALLAVGGVGLAAQFYARSVNADFVAKDFAAMTHIAQLRTNMRTVYLVSGVMGFIIGLVALGTWYLQRTICNPLKQVVKVAHAIGEGDLTIRIDTQRHDEIGDVLRSLHHMSGFGPLRVV